MCVWLPKQWALARAAVREAPTEAVGRQDSPGARRHRCAQRHERCNAASPRLAGRHRPGGTSLSHAVASRADFRMPRGQSRSTRIGLASAQVTESYVRLSRGITTFLQWRRASVMDINLPVTSPAGQSSPRRCNCRKPLRRASRGCARGR